MESKHSVNLTAAELSQLWNTYMSDTMALCVIRYFLETTQDQDVLPVLERALSISKRHISEIKQIFQQEGAAIPLGFTEDDVNVNAPALFYDTFYLYYIKQMSRVGISAYGLGLSISARSDVRSFFKNTLTDSMELDELVTNIQLHKGLFIRAPFINVPNQVKFVERVNFLDGIVGEHRPLLGIEVAHLYGNIQTAALAKALCIGFSQTSKSKEVQKFMIKSRDKAGKHIELLGNKLNGSHLKVPMTWNDAVTESTASPFSDKLMMFHISTVIATAMADYGISIAASARRDLGILYAGLIAEMGLHLEDATKIMIENGWMEKPPSAGDRNALANS